MHNLSTPLTLVSHRRRRTLGAQPGDLDGTCVLSSGRRRAQFGLSCLDHVPSGSTFTFGPITLALLGVGVPLFYVMLLRRRSLSRIPHPLELVTSNVLRIELVANTPLDVLGEVEVNL